MKNNNYYIDIQMNNYSSSHKKTLDDIKLTEDVIEAKGEK